ncbi:MAG TPA: hypothetical protein VF807_04405 [Ktedonobacterales bacterium]
MDAVNAALAPLPYWNGILLTCALITGLEAPLLFLITALRQRPLYELIVALAPGVVCFWALTVARQARVDFASYLALADFTAEHYPVTFMRPVLNDINTEVGRIVWLSRGIALAMLAALVLGALMVVWQRRAEVRLPPRRQARALAGVSANPSGSELDTHREPLDP